MSTLSQFSLSSTHFAQPTSSITLKFYCFEVAEYTEKVKFHLCVYILIEFFPQHFKVKKFTLPLYSVYSPTAQSKPDGKMPPCSKH